MKVVFKSGDAFLAMMPHKWRRPMGVWTKDINDALQVEAQVYADRIVAPWSFGPTQFGDITRYFGDRLPPAALPVPTPVNTMTHSAAWE